jgi:hypothetical protein
VWVFLVEEGLMWTFSSMDGGEFSWVDMLLVFEGFLKCYLSTHVAITSLEEEEAPIFVLAYPMVERHTAWKV